ncbi:hypothetical protein AB5J72_21150 [Streptomyces sp. CG1]
MQLAQALVDGDHLEDEQSVHAGVVSAHHAADAAIDGQRRDGQW